MPFFTVIIPLYNKEMYVEKALQSIFNQTFKDFEILIVNDASTDESVKKITPFVSKNVKLIHHSQNKGLSATRNTGIKNANANYITYLDADDTWKPTFLETIYRLINNFPDAQIFATNYVEVYNYKIFIPHNGSETLAADFEGIINFFKINLKQGIYNHGSVCFHKAVFETVGFYDESINFSEDLDFNIRANSHFKLAYSTKRLMEYYMDIDNQLTRKSLKNNTIPDFGKYEVDTKINKDLKKYLDFERYVLAKRLKISNDIRWKDIAKQINPENLNSKQRILLKLPVFVLNCIKNIKFLFIKNGIKFSTYK
jgi:glycosyltransferase involved in cell wall biosynthesis